MLEFSLVGGNMNKSELYEYFIKIISEKDSVDIENYKNNINIVINKLFDLSNDNVLSLNSKLTYMLRLRYGILNNGKTLSFNAIGTITSLSGERVRMIISQAEDKLKSFILYWHIIQDKTLNFDKPLNENIMLNNSDLNEIGLSDETLKLLLNLKITTLYELLFYTFDDLKKLGLPSIVLKEIENKLKDIGVNFADKLNLSERLKLMQFFDDKRNLSASYINSHNKLKSFIFEEIPRLTIGDVLEEIKETNQIIPWVIIKNLEDMGFEIPLYKKVDTFLANEKEFEAKIKRLAMLNCSFDELMTVKLRSFGVGIRRYFVYADAEKSFAIITLGDLLKIKRKDLDKVLGIGELIKSKLLTIVHGLGLYFPDEIEFLKIYCEEIQNNLNEKSTTLSLKKVKNI